MKYCDSDGNASNDTLVPQRKPSLRAAQQNFTTRAEGRTNYGSHHQAGCYEFRTTGAPCYHSPMANLSAVVEQLKAERERVRKEAQRIDSALAALGSISNRTVTAASRRKMAAAQKARWAKVKRAN